LLAKKEQTFYTCKDYDAWDDGQRYELIAGEKVLLASPRPLHQLISKKLVTQFDSYLGGGECEVFYAPFDLKVSEDTVVQPDILVICEEIDLSEMYTGIPILVIEILSKSTRARDLMSKTLLYMKLGVKYYLAVDTDEQLVYVNVLVGQWYEETVYNFEDDIELADFPGLKVSLKDTLPHFATST
jgi:Uma2 family endonuclease